MTTVGIATGAGSGMGAACATRLAEMVDVLLLVDRNEASVVDAAARLAGGRAEPRAVGLDITDRDGLAGLASQVADAGTLRAISHAAGISPAMADWRDVMTVDLSGTALLVEALRPLVTEGTAAVCFASVAALMAGGATGGDPVVDAALDDPLAPELHERLQAALGEGIENSGMAYMQAKRGVIRLVQREAVNFGRVGARINSLSPGIIDTPMNRLESDTQSTNAMMVGITPLAREGRPSEIAATVAFLLSDEASFINGIDVLVDGGFLAAAHTQGMPGAGAASEG